MMFEEYQQLIKDAGKRVYSVANRTSLDYAVRISLQTGNDIRLKREDQQPVFSYKVRGGFNLISNLSKQQQAAGVITASAGNHAQGLALAAQKQGVSAVIVMPKTTPEIKVYTVKRLQAKVIMHGTTFDDAMEYALTLAEQQGRLFISLYDHPLVIAGQATVGVEIMEQHPQTPDMIFVPIGGGGLIAGIAVHIKSTHPNIKIIGVEPDEAPCMHHALAADERVALEQIGIFADGAAVKQAGKEPFRIARELVDEVLLVSIDEICAAVKDIFEDTRSIPEPAGALALAGVKQYIAREGIRDKRLVAIVSGANVNFDRLRHIAELSALGGNHEALIGAVIPDKPGSFKRFCHDLGPRSITEFNYRYADPTNAHVFAGIALRNGIEEKQALLASLKEKAYEVVDLSDDVVAKMHVRHMVGGHAPQARDEQLFRFEFPERPGAFLHFLNALGERWNISLFHYRNHGAAYGRVLMGIQIKEQERAEFREFIDGLGIKYWPEENNPAYKMFLR